MDKKNLMPNQSSPVSRMTAGQLPPELAELAEETLCSYDGGDIVPSSQCGAASCGACGFFCFGVGGGLVGVGVGGGNGAQCFCSYDGDDAE
ncbi:MAG: microcyclamide/patellamide family RiPP [Leptolyngbya sp. SIO1D8]|nr:microcyclamide/patellamide family RiPP [Leptolyngbya sp. SIO1D8]